MLHSRVLFSFELNASVHGSAYKATSSIHRSICVNEKIPSATIAEGLTDLNGAQVWGFNPSCSPLLTSSRPITVEPYLGTDPRLGGHMQASMQSFFINAQFIFHYFECLLHIFAKVAFQIFFHTIHTFDRSATVASSFYFNRWQRLVYLKHATSCVISHH